MHTPKVMIAFLVVCLLGVTVAAPKQAVADGASGALANSVVVESKTAAGSSSAGVYVENSNSLKTLVLPLSVRAIETYPTALAGEYVIGGRLDASPFGMYTITYYDSENGNCKQSQPGGFGGDYISLNEPGTVVAPNPSNPDAFTFVRGTIFCCEILPGSDGTPVSGSPSIRIQFTCPPDVVAGQRFLIDTTCTDPANHLLFVDAATGIGVPVSVTPGTITCLPCACPRQGDLNDDGFYDVFDLLILVDILFKGHPDVQSPDCIVSKSDLDGDGFTTALDLPILINHIFAGGPQPSDPCAP